MKLKLLALLCLTHSFSATSQSLAVGNFENLMAHVCVDPNIAAAAKMQVSVAKDRLNISEYDAWMPDVTLGVDVYSAKGQPTSFFAVQDGEVQDPAEPNFYQKGKAWQGKVDFSWGLYNEGKWVGQNGLTHSEAFSGYEIAQSQLSSARREAIELIGQYYFNVLVYSAQLEVLRPLVEKRKAQLESFEAKVAAGVNTKDDYFTAKSAYASLQERLVQASRQLDVNLNFLQLMTTKSLDVLSSKNERSLSELASIVDRELALGDINKLVQSHPDVSLLTAKLELENQKLTAQKGKLKPNLNLYVKLRTADNFDNGLRKDYGEVGLTLEYPLGEVVSNYGESQALQKSITALSIELTYLKKVKMLQAANIAGDLESAKGNIAVASIDLEQKVHALQSKTEQVESGVLGLDELVKSEDDKINSQISLLNAYNQAWMKYIQSVIFTDSACQMVSR